MANALKILDVLQPTLKLFTWWSKSRDRSHSHSWWLYQWGGCRNEWRQGPPLDEAPVHCIILYRHLWVQYLAQEYFCSALKMFWHLPALPEHLSTLGLEPRTPPLLIPVPNRPSYHCLSFLSSIALIITKYYESQFLNTKKVNLSLLKR